MTIARLLAACVLLLLPAVGARADWDDAMGPQHARIAMVPPPQPVPPHRLPAEPLPSLAGQPAPIAALACYASAVTCPLLLPRRPGTPCHCRTRFGEYLGKAQ